MSEPIGPIDSTPARTAEHAVHAAPVLQPVVRQHAEEAAMLRHQRSALVRAPHIGLLMLGRHDQRIAAHLDGLAEAGAAGAVHAAAVLEEGIPGAMAGEAFALGVALVSAGEGKGLDALAARCAAQPDLQRGLASALGWVSADLLRGVVREWLAGDVSAKRICALSACAMHRVDPGPALAPALAAQAEPSVRAAALRTAGRVGRVDLLPAIGAAAADGDKTVAFWAAWAACRLGERAGSARKMLAETALSNSGFADSALALLMCALPDAEAHEVARHVSAQAKADGTAAHQRRLVLALGLLGDMRFAPWLIERMDDPLLARAAGEAFVAITGTDLSAKQLERLDGPPPGPNPAEGAGPSEDDEPIELEPDRDLPWPDRARVANWWQQQQQQAGAPDAALQRHFLGRPFGEAAWLHGLREGNQRQRALAALHLAVHAPTSRMFPVAAPAWRQRRWLDPSAR